MLSQSSYYIWSFFLCLLSHDQIHVSSGIICKPGEKVSLTRTKCEPCPVDQYNPKASESNECRNCEPCGSYSLQVSACSPTSNTKCRCVNGFTSYERTQRICRCLKGSGIKTLENGEQICEKCPPNTFTNISNSECKLLPQLVQNSENFPGNASSDVNRGNEAKTGVLTSSPLSLSQRSTSTSTMIPTTSRNSVSTPTTSVPEFQDTSKHALWLAFLTALLLLILILKLSRFSAKKKDIVRVGSECGKPVEESGEKCLPPA